jgi:hypothetical protein
LNFIIRCKFVVTFTPRRFRQGKIAPTTHYIQLDGPHNRLRRRSEEKISTCQRVLNPASPAIQPVSVHYTDEYPALQLHTQSSRSCSWNDGCCFSSCVFTTNRKLKVGKRFSSPYRNVTIRIM